MTNEQLSKIIKRAARVNGECVESFVEAVGGEDEAIKLLQEHPWEESFAYNFKRGERFLESEYGAALREAAGAGAVSASATAVFSVLGVTAAVVGAYEAPKDFVGNMAMYVEQSKTQQEPKAWLYRPDLPEQIDDLQMPGQSNFYPRNLVVTNSEYGKSWAISRRAIDDDQVGQFARIPAQIGEGHASHEEIIFAGYLFSSASGTYSTNGVSVPVPTYSDPDGTKGFYKTTGTRANAITPAALSQQSIQDLITLSKAIQDPGGKTMLVRPSLLIGGTNVSFQASAILNSTFWPSSMSGAATPTVTGTFSTVNPLDPKWGALRAPLDYREEPFYNGTADLPDGTSSSKNLWFIIDPKKNGIVKQERMPLEVTMESPLSGGSWSTRSYNYRTYRRFAVYQGDARFCFRGSNGSV